MRSNVTLDQYMYEIRHETNELQKSDRFPDELLFKWIHKDILETVLRLGGLINNLYRKVSGNLAVNSAAGAFEATASHTSGVLLVTGFTGLTPDAWINGSLICVSSNLLFCSQIADNDETTVTQSVNALPVLADSPVFLTHNDSGEYVSLSSLNMMNFPEPIWQVKDGSGNTIEMMSLDVARNIVNIPAFDGKVFWYQVGQQLNFALGDGASLSGNVTVGYYEQPTEADALAEYIDMPWEWHNLAQKRTEVRILKSKGEYDKARQKEVDLEQRYQELERSTLQAKPIDQQYRERI